MLYVATIHFNSPRWIEIQTRYLREHIPVPYQVWTSLEGIDQSYSIHFDRVIQQMGPHAGKLNHLALEISHEAEDSDLLMFLDGDAFPIADPMPLITDSLAKAPLLAVRRAEHLDDPQPHPCFCVTTVGTWRSLPGDWSKGHTWPLGPGGAPWTDVGANLLRELELKGTPWIELLRSNGTDLDPIYFAVYGNVVYHHGSSFRPTTLSGVHHRSSDAPAQLQVPRLPGLAGVVRLLNRRRWRRWERSTLKRRSELSKSVFDRIQRGDSSWLADLRVPSRAGNLAADSQ